MKQRLQKRKYKKRKNRLNPCLILVFRTYFTNGFGIGCIRPETFTYSNSHCNGLGKTIRGLAANVQNELKQELKLQELQDSIKKRNPLTCKPFHQN